MALLLSGGSPALAGGAPGRPAPAKLAKQRQAKAKARVAVSRPAAAARPGASKSSLQRGSRLQGLFRSGKAKSKPTASALSKRQMIRDRQRETRGQLKSGNLSVAARTVTRSTRLDANNRFSKNQIRKLTIRERFAMWRMARKVRRTAMKSAKARSKVGDVAGTRDALSALQTLESGGRLGVISRWRKARVEKRAFKNSVKAARRAMKNGDLSRAAENQAFASELRPNTRANRNAMRKLAKDSFKLAKTYSKAGNPEATWQVLQMSAELSQMSGAKFNEKASTKMMDRAFRGAGKALVKEANAAYRQRSFDMAAQKLVEVSAMQEAGVNIKLSRGQRRQIRRLTQKLGPRVDAVRAAMNNQADAEGEAALAVQ